MLTINTKRKDIKIQTNAIIWAKLLLTATLTKILTLTKGMLS